MFKITQRRKAKTEKEQQKMLSKTQNIIKTNNDANESIILGKHSKIIPNSLAHLRKPRKKYFGEEIQMDPSQYFWIEWVKWHLHLAIDDSNSAIGGAYFTTQETLAGYYHLLKQILTNYGIPYRTKTDNRIVFNYNLIKEKENLILNNKEKDSHIQFGYAYKQLGIELITISIPQAKGRVRTLSCYFAI